MTSPKETQPVTECRFAVYSKAKDGQSDIHLIKEQVHNPDGTLSPKIRIVKDFQRDFYVAKPGARKYKDRKEWEKLSNLGRFKCTQTKLSDAVFRALGQPGFRGTLRDFSESRFAYGTDILSTAIIKQGYRDKWDVVTPYTYSVFDTETDVNHGTNEIIMATITFKEKVYTVVQRSFVKGYADPIPRIHALAQKHLGEIFAQRNLTMEVVLVDSEIDIIKLIMLKAHAWRPDFLAVWNLTFDMGKIIEACARAGIEPEELLCDPAVPDKYKSFKFKIGPAKKVSSSGVVQSFTPAQRWHTVFCPSSFYWIDAMCVYRSVRTGQPEEPSYGLDAILQKDLNIGKLKFKEADAYTGLEWHKFMQSNYPLEYIIYNQFDCISMEMLDEKNLDVQLSLPMFAGCSDFQHFNSQPRRSANALHYFVKKHGHIIASTASEMKDENDELTVSIANLIVMLDAHLIEDNGLKILQEAPMQATSCYVDVADLDVAGALFFI